MLRGVIPVILAILLPVAALAGDFEVAHPGAKANLTTAKGKVKQYGLLRAGESTRIQVSGPGLMNLRVRQLLAPAAASGSPVHLDVTRDGAAWAAVDLVLPVDAKDRVCDQGPVSALRLFQIEVPSGTHTYEVTPTGDAGRGVLLRVTRTKKAKPAARLGPPAELAAAVGAEAPPLAPLTPPPATPEPATAPDPAVAPEPATAPKPTPPAAPAPEPTVTVKDSWADASKIKMAVLNIAAQGADKDTAANVTHMVATELGGLGPFSVISSQEILTMLSFEQDRRLLGCSDASCLAEIGGALGAEFLVSGSLGKIGDTHVLALQLMNINQAEVVARESREVKGDAAPLLEQARGAARRLVTDVLKLQSGYLVLQVNENAAKIQVDGDLIGVSPLSRLELPGGTHTVKVEKDGFIVWAQDVAVPPKQTAVREIALIPSPEFVEAYESQALTYRVLAWVGTGLGVAAAGVGFGLLIAQEPRRKDLADDIDAYNAGTAGPGVDRADLQSRQDDLNTEYLAYQIVGYGGLALLGASLYFWLAGDEPGKYQEFRAEAPRTPELFFGAAPTPGGGTAAVGGRW